ASTRKSAPSARRCEGAATTGLYLGGSDVVPHGAAAQSSVGCPVRWRPLVRVTVLGFGFFLFVASLGAGCAAGGHRSARGCRGGSRRIQAARKQRPPTTRVRLWTIAYHAHDGTMRAAYVELPL